MWQLPGTEDFTRKYLNNESPGISSMAEAYKSYTSLLAKKSELESAIIANGAHPVVRTTATGTDQILSVVDQIVSAKIAALTIQLKELVSAEVKKAEESRLTVEERKRRAEEEEAAAKHMKLAEEAKFKRQHAFVFTTKSSPNIEYCGESKVISNFGPTGANYVLGASSLPTDSATSWEVEVLSLPSKWLFVGIVGTSSITEKVAYTHETSYGWANTANAISEGKYEPTASSIWPGITEGDKLTLKYCPVSNKLYCFVNNKHFYMKTKPLANAFIQFGFYYSNTRIKVTSLYN